MVSDVARYPCRARAAGATDSWKKTMVLAESRPTRLLHCPFCCARGPSLGPILVQFFPAQLMHAVN